MGIPVSSGYIQFVPAGVRATLAYPTPVQTARDFDRGMRSDLYKRVVNKVGEKAVLAAIRKDAALLGSPLKHVLKSLENKEKVKEEVSCNFLSGTYPDGLPYNGAIAILNLREQKWDFAAISVKGKPRPVNRIVKSVKNRTGLYAKIAWNGGYILNPELVGKLGLPESYIGSPLGLFIEEGRMTSPPLYNKPALMVHKDGTVDIQRVNCSRGLVVSGRGDDFVFESSDYNVPGRQGRRNFYDLLYPNDYIDGNGRTIIRLAGNVVKEVLRTEAGEKIPVIPVGITLVLGNEDIPEWMKTGEVLELRLPGLESVQNAVEAGPLLIEHGRRKINMEVEGWTCSNSIRTQAARLDYTAMRGPKIAVGISTNNKLAVLTINGRTRESVGATYSEMAEILEKYGMDRAMGFDPGGSSTLVVNGETLNISPYNSKYEKDVYALPPEPRSVSNAILGFTDV